MCGDIMATNRGYIPLGGERLSADLPPDQKEAYNIGPEGTQDLWPDLPGWRETLQAYFTACHDLGRALHRALAEILGVPGDFFEASLEHPAAVLRLLHYPMGTGANAEAGAGAHTDYGNITILATDGVAGLQVRDRSGRWIDVAGIEGGFVCNIGDCLMRWTNAVFVSTPHRVVAPPAERYSVAFFLDPDFKAMIEPILTPEAPEPLFAPISAGDYILSKLAPTYAHVAGSQ
jgi:isopenicillin N synthase-like dioxygenase